MNVPMVILPPKNLQNGWKITTPTERKKIDNKQTPPRNFSPAVYKYVYLFIYAFDIYIPI